MGKLLPESLQRQTHCSNQGGQQDKSTWQRTGSALRLHWRSTQRKRADRQGCVLTPTSHSRKTEYLHLLLPHIMRSFWPQPPPPGRSSEGAPGGWVLGQSKYLLALNVLPWYPERDLLRSSSPSTGDMCAVLTTQGCMCQMESNHRSPC